MDLDGFDELRRRSPASVVRRQMVRRAGRCTVAWSPDLLLHQHPRVFSVPPRFVSHMMVGADLGADGDAAVEEAVTAAWRLQTEDGEPQGKDASDG